MYALTVNIGEKTW